MKTDAKHELERARLLLKTRQRQRGIAAIPFIAVVLLMAAEVFMNRRFWAPEKLFFAAFTALILALPFHLRTVTAAKKYLTASKDLRASE